MAKKKIDMKEELRQMRFDMNFVQKIDCSKEENKNYSEAVKNGEPLPEGVFQYKLSSTGEPIDEFYTVYDPELSDSEKQEYIQYQSLLHMRTIKNCVLFFTIVAIISLLAYVIMILQ